jgi:hypothetical protein
MGAGLQQLPIQNIDSPFGYKQRPALTMLSSPPPAPATRHWRCLWTFRLPVGLTPADITHQRTKPLAADVPAAAAPTPATSQGEREQRQR